MFAGMFLSLLQGRRQTGKNPIPLTLGNLSYNGNVDSISHSNLLAISEDSYVGNKSPQAKDTASLLYGGAAEEKK